MKYTILIPVFLLATACSHTSTIPPTVVPAQIPPLPANLSVRAEPLPPITDNTMGGLIRDGINTDRRYNDVAAQLNSLIDVYECIRRTYNDHSSAEKCL